MQDAVIVISHIYKLIFTVEKEGFSIFFERLLFTEHFDLFHSLGTLQL